MTKKKWGLVCTIGLLLLITVFCILTFAPTFTSSANQPEISVRAATWNFHNGPVTGDHEYSHDFGVYEKNYDVFEISTFQGLKNLSLSMGTGGRVGRCDFYGKTIKLTANIDCGGESMGEPLGWEDVVHANVGLAFMGTFDGQGFTISNLMIKTGTMEMNHFGMFVASTGTIKNTIFKNFRFYIGSGDENTGYYSIVARNQGTIENCVVDGCYFQSGRFKSNCKVAPIAGENSGTVKNCIVRGIYEIAGKDGNGILNDDGLYAHYFVITGTEAIYCVFDATMKESGVTTELYQPSEHDTALTSGNYNYNSYTAAYTNFPSSVANSNASGTTPWYKYTKTSTGAYRGYGGSSSVPIYLRAFIKWETYYFSVAKINGVSPGTVSTSSVTVPSDYKTVGTTNNTKTVYGITITATAYNNYEFVSWTSSTSIVNGKTITTYTASFRMSDFDVSFADDDSSEYGNSGMGKISYRYGSNSFTTVTTVSFKVSQGSSVQISFLTSHSECSYPTSGTKYAVVKMTFTGKRMISGSPESTARNYEVLFVLTSGDYYISSAKVTKSAEYAYTTNQSITIDRATSFTVRYAVRDYGLEIV